MVKPLEWDTDSHYKTCQLGDGNQITIEGPKVRSVKNWLSDLTKEQEGQDWLRNDIKIDCQGKALKEGCHEREWAQVGVFHREDKHQKELN